MPRLSIRCRPSPASCCGSARATRLRHGGRRARTAGRAAGDKGPTVAMLTAMVRGVERIDPDASGARGAAAAEPARCGRTMPPSTRPHSPGGLRSRRQHAQSCRSPRRARRSSSAGRNRWRRNHAPRKLRADGNPSLPLPEEGTAVIFTSNIFTSKIEPANPRQSMDSRPGPPNRRRPRTRCGRTSGSGRRRGCRDRTRSGSAAPEAPEPSEAVETYFDPTDFLFGPEPEPDPAAFLLDPAPPPRRTKAVFCRSRNSSPATRAARGRGPTPAAEGRSPQRRRPKSSSRTSRARAARSAACAQGDEPEREARDFLVRAPAFCHSGAHQPARLRRLPRFGREPESITRSIQVIGTCVMDSGSRGA